MKYRVILGIFFLIFLSISVFAASSTTAFNTIGGVYNGGFEYGGGDLIDNNGWVGGDSNYGWYEISYSPAASLLTAQYDDTNHFYGLKSMHLIGAATGWGVISNVPTDDYNSIIDDRGKHLIPVENGSEYRLELCIKSDGLDASNGIIRVAVYDKNFQLLNRNLVHKHFGGTFDWNCYDDGNALLFTSPGNYVAIEMGTENASTDFNLWFDGVRLEQLAKKNYALTTQISGTPAVTLTGQRADINISIDQNQIDYNTTWGFGEDLILAIAQKFQPDFRNFTGISIRKAASTGTFVGNITITIMEDDPVNGHPSWISLANRTFTAAQWNALSNTDETYIIIPHILKQSATNDVNYWIVLWSDTNDSANHPNIRGTESNANAYPLGGIEYKDPEAEVWLDFQDGNHIFFKTHFQRFTGSLDGTVESIPLGLTQFREGDTRVLLNDANFTIYPDGNGRYYYNSGTFTYSNPNTWLMVANMYDYNTYGFEPFWNDGIAIVLPEDYILHRLDAPPGCTFRGTANVLQYVDNLDFTHVLDLNVGFGTYGPGMYTYAQYLGSEGASSTTVRQVNIDGNTTIYLSAGLSDGMGLALYHRFSFDANVTCGPPSVPMYAIIDMNTWTMNHTWLRNEIPLNIYENYYGSFASRLFLYFNHPSTIMTQTVNPVNPNQLFLTFDCTAPETWQNCAEIDYDCGGGVAGIYGGVPVTVTRGTNTACSYYSGTDQEDWENPNITTLVFGTSGIPQNTCGLVNTIILVLVAALLVILASGALYMSSSGIDIKVLIAMVVSSAAFLIIISVTNVVVSGLCAA